MVASVYSVISRFFRRLDSRFRVMLVAVGINSWIRGLPSQYNQLFASDLGANPVELGFLESIGGVANSIVSAPTGWFIDRYGVKRVIIFGFVLSAIVSGIYGIAVDWRMLIPAIVLAQMSMRMIVPLTDIIFVGTTKPRERALAMGFSRTIWAIPNMFAPITAALIVTRFGGINVQGIRPLYTIQLAAIIFVVLFVALMLKAPSTRPSVDKDGSMVRTGLIEDFKDLFRGERWLKELTVIMSAWRFGMRAVVPFIPLWMVNVKGADPYILGTMGTIGIITSALLQIPAGRLADKIGRKRVFLLLRPFAYLGTILLIVAPTPEFLIPLGALGVAGMMVMGGVGNVSFVPFITMYWEMVPAEKRGRWFGFTGIFNILIVPASILCGFMWQAGLMELVLILPVLVEVLIVIPMLTIIPDTLGRSA